MEKLNTFEKLNRVEMYYLKILAATSVHFISNKQVNKWTGMIMITVDITITVKIMMKIMIMIKIMIKIMIIMLQIK